MTPTSLLLIGGLLLTACLGLAGGQPSPRARADFALATLEVKTPGIIRNGEFFETEIEVRSKAGIEEAVLAVEPRLWRDMTINTMIPAAAEEEFRRGEFRFSYGPLEAGETLRIKIDGQINPPLFAGTDGAIAVYDGDRLIGRQPISIRVLP
ncbi:hypothetical protein E5675_15695 [Sphingopyxis sp. PAMC25046]|uniref:hypothetical protein n=1 Tax=Sphingopyxis sp. PAMC25046 TaxID=2565556 RepID=UPI00109DC4F2|nr:hypothetical protein [Sphingopyxis sp. PAMC25046]QCB55734.1 hypothetical protein E5675_15695 [Sphingopyxis sp. PAMC25046]